MIHSTLLKDFTNTNIFCAIQNCEELIPVKCVDVYDGDTMKLAFHILNNPNYPIGVFNCRLIGIDTPEIKTKNVLEKEAGKKARDYVRSECLNKCIWAKIQNGDKYGRLLVEIFTELDLTESLNQKIIKLGYAKNYDGGTKESFDLKY